MENLRYPIGKYALPKQIDEDYIPNAIEQIETFPARLKKLLNNLPEDQLLWSYRSNGWTIKQLVHHCADSHMNSFIRFKLALTEDSPTIKPYHEDQWAELPDTVSTPIEESLKILEGLHARWTQLLKALSQEDLKKQFVHPEHGKRVSLSENIGLYAWHGNHHLAHIKQAITSEGKFKEAPLNQTIL